MRNAFLVILFLLGKQSYSQDILTLNKSTEKISLNKYLYLYEDKKSKLELNEILNNKIEFVKNYKEYISYGYDRSSIWGKFYPVSENPSAEWYLLFEFSMIDNIDVYLPDKDGSYKKIETGNRKKFQNRVFDHRKLIVPFKANSKPYPVYFRVQSNEDTVDIQVSVTSNKGLLDSIEMETFVFSLILGIVLLIIIYTLVLYMMTGEKLYLLYLLYVGLFWTMQLCIAGYVYKYVFPGNYELVRITRSIAGNFSAGFGIYFCIEFLKLRVNFPRYARFLSAVAVVFFINGSLVQSISYALHVFIFLADLLLLSIGLIISGIISYKYFSYARYYLIAWAIFLVILLVYSLRQFDFYIPYFSTNSLVYGSYLEMLFLSFALGKRVQVLRDEKEDLKLLSLKNEYRLQNLEMKNISLEKDLDIAREMQKSLIPDLSKYEKFASIYLPMEKVGGDFFDILDLNENQKGIFFCDVTGHGVPAAFITNFIKSSITNELNRYHSSPGTSTWLTNPDETFRYLNQILNSHSNQHYLSAVYGILDTSKKTFTYISCNHPPVMYFTRKDQDQDNLEFYSSSPQLPLLGVFSSDEFRNFKGGIQRLSLQDHSRLILYSDGFLDLIQYDFEDYRSGLNSFSQSPAYNLFSSGLSLKNKEFKDELFKIIRELLKSETPPDDICILSIEI